MLVAFKGKIGSGKSTASKVLVGYTRVSFSDPLKMIGEIFGFSKEQLYGTQEQKREIHDEWKISAREFLQKFGTNIIRGHLREEIPNMNLNNMSAWARIFELRVSKLLKQGKNVVCDDVRFPDEANLIKKLGGVIIEIVRNNDLDRVHGNHISERSMDQITPDIIINNDGSLDKFKNDILSIISMKSS